VDTSLDDDDESREVHAESTDPMTLSESDMHAKVNHLILSHQSPHNVAEAMKRQLLVARRSRPIHSDFATRFKHVPCTTCLRDKSKAEKRRQG
jgi:RecJ-like exonuclease